MEQMIVQMESVDVTPYYRTSILDVSKLTSTEYRKYRKRLRWNFRKNLLSRKHPKWVVEQDQEIVIYYDESLERISNG